MFCTDISSPLFLIFSNDVPGYIYYFHFPATIVSLFFGIYILKSDKGGTQARIFFLISLLFAVWSFLSLITWANIDSAVIMFSWSLNVLIYLVMLYLLCIFWFSLIFKKEIPLTLNIFFLAIIASAAIITPTVYNLLGFHLSNCESIENSLTFNFVYYLSFLISFLILLSSVILYKNKNTQNKKQLLTVTLGIISFILIFYGTGYLGSLTDNYLIDPIGLTGMTILIGFLAFLIVRFKTFNIKLLGAQALVWSLIILIGSQFFFIQTTINKVLTGITLIISAIAGMLIVRSVKKEVALRESLEIANENQMVLVRFITHQVKGFFTKSKYIFAGLLEGDFGPISPEVKDVAQLGIESDKKAVDMIVDILNASNLKTGLTGFTFEEVNFGDFVREIADSFKQRALDKSLTFETKISDKALMVSLDKMQMTQVIKNLIDNAINYTPTGLVSVYLNEGIHDGKKIIKFSVTDSGVGLTEKDKSVLFREGGRGEESVKVNVNSTGYGLFIVKKIVEGHRGSIYATSDGRNKGATFTVELPKVGKK